MSTQARFFSSSLLPLSGAVFLLAVTGGCIIINDGGDAGDEDCVELNDACPNLTCDTGNVVVDGCPICECAPVCEPGPAPECANPILLDDCTWTCGTSECFSDVDCGDGFFCSFTDGTIPPGGDVPEGAPDAAPVAPGGVCLPLEQPLGCFSDLDCGTGFFCDLTAAGGGSGGGASDPAPPPPDGGGAERPAPPQFEGFCAPLNECFSDVDCAESEHCEFPGLPNGLVAIGGICVDDVVSECSADEDCGEGFVCAVECGQDSNCPNCDVCLFVGTCVEVDRPCGSDAECDAGEFCDFNTADRIACIDADNDGVCDTDPVPALGVCRASPVTGCEVDTDCAEGQICALTDQCVCDAQCRDDGMGGCLPCECPPAGGVCIDQPLTPCATVRCNADTTCQVALDGTAACVPNEGQCASDAECAAGTHCNAGIDFCLPSPNCVDGQNCIDLCYGFCVVDVVSCFDDAGCAADETCVFDPTIDGGANRPIIAPQGTCQPRDPTLDPCAAVRCAQGTTCEVNAAGDAECVATVGTCASDNECPADTRCNAGAEVCNTSPDCVAGEPCIDVCFGFCVAP